MNRKILIVDDEQPARDRIRKLLAQNIHASQFEIAEAANGIEALEIIPQFSPDIVFIDMEMPEMTGIDVLYQLENKTFMVIFQTAYPQFALQAFELSATDFLLKPYTRERFDEALARALVNLEKKIRLEELETELIKRRNYMRRFVVKIGQRTKIIDEEEILCFTSEEHVTQLHLDHIAYAYQYSLTFIEERSDPDKFLRVHKNAVVNIAATVSYSKTRPMYVTLRNGTQLRVAREREKSVREVLESKNKL